MSDPKYHHTARGLLEAYAPALIGTGIEAALAEALEEAEAEGRRQAADQPALAQPEADDPDELADEYRQAESEE